MCDFHAKGRFGWGGWSSRPARCTGIPAGPWHDLSHCIHDGLPTPHVFAPPIVERVASMPGAKLNVTRLTLVCHVGTHLDAPSHLFVDGPGFDAIPADRLQGPGVVWPFELRPFQEITPAMLAAMRPEIEPGDMVLICARWSDRFGQDSYFDNPALTVPAAEWLRDRGISLLGVDFLTPDAALDRRPPDFDWPVRKILLGSGILIAENLTNLAPLAGRRVEVVCGALNLRGADGSPARIFARAVTPSAG